MTRTAVVTAAAKGGVTLLLAGVVAALAVHVCARWFGLPIVGGAAVAQLLFIWLGIGGLAVFAAGEGGSQPNWRQFGLSFILAFAAIRLGWGAVQAGSMIGGTEAVTGLAQWVRYAGAGAIAGSACIVACIGHWSRVVGVLAGAALALILPPLPFYAAAIGFAALLALRCPPALALLSAGTTADLGLSEPAFAQTILRGLNLSVLLAVPLFILAAGCLVASGLAGRLVDLAQHLTRHRRTAMAEANVLASGLFGGFSGSSLADAALGGRLLVPAMVQAGYGSKTAVALTASASLLPNILPPSLALLLAAAVTNQSVAALWLAGVGAGATLGLLLWGATRLVPPTGSALGAAVKTEERPSWGVALAPLLGIALILVGLRGGFVTATEAGLVAVLAALGHGLATTGPKAMVAAFTAAADQTARIALLIGAVAPLSFFIATSGFSPSALLEGFGGWTLALLVLGVALVAGTVLDVGAGILLLLPLLLPQLMSAGFDPLQATVALTVVMLAGGLTPPVGLLVLTVAQVSAQPPAWVAVLPYLALILLAALLILAIPALTLWLPTRL
ncbi:MAG: TRAP transporter large permease subunit [Pseudomonadota bacterium]